MGGKGVGVDGVICPDKFNNRAMAWELLTQKLTYLIYQKNISI
jgi:hypothetical protein